MSKCTGSSSADSDVWEALVHSTSEFVGPWQEPGGTFKPNNPRRV